MTEQPDATHRRQRSWRLSPEQRFCDEAFQNLRVFVASPYQPSHSPRWRFQGDNFSRNNSPGNRGILSCGPVADALLMEISSSRLGKSTEVRCCLKTVWDNCVGSIARPACTTAQSDRSGVAGGSPAGPILLTANFAWGTPSTTDDSPGIKTQRPVVRQQGSNFPGPSSKLIETSSGSPSSARASAMALPRCVVQKKQRHQRAGLEQMHRYKCLLTWNRWEGTAGSAILADSLRLKTEPKCCGHEASRTGRSVRLMVSPLMFRPTKKGLWVGAPSSAVDKSLEHDDGTFCVCDPPGRELICFHEWSGEDRKQ